MKLLQYILLCLVTTMTLGNTNYCSAMKEEGVESKQVTITIDEQVEPTEKPTEKSKNNKIKITTGDVIMGVSIFVSTAFLITSGILYGCINSNVKKIDESQDDIFLRHISFANHIPDTRAVINENDALKEHFLEQNQYIQNQIEEERDEIIGKVTKGEFCRNNIENEDVQKHYDAALLLASFAEQGQNNGTFDVSIGDGELVKYNESEKENNKVYKMIVYGDLIEVEKQGDISTDLKTRYMQSANQPMHFRDIFNGQNNKTTVMIIRNTQSDYKFWVLMEAGELGKIITINSNCSFSFNMKKSIVENHCNTKKMTISDYINIFTNTGGDIEKWLYQDGAFQYQNGGIKTIDSKEMIYFSGEIFDEIVKINDSYNFANIK